MAVFKVTLAGRWSEDDGWVELAGLPADAGVAEDGSSNGEDEEIDDA